MTKPFYFNWASGKDVIIENAQTYLTKPIWFSAVINTTTDGSYFSDPQWEKYRVVFIVSDWLVVN